MSKDYNLKIITKFNENGNKLESIILNILQNNILPSTQIDFQNDNNKKKNAID